jgi:hypothetical protein
MVEVMVKVMSSERRKEENNHRPLKSRNTWGLTQIYRGMTSERKLEEKVLRNR